jgi:hypothetical protein
MDEQLPTPVDALAGYPLTYARSLQPRRVDATRCTSLLVRREALALVGGAFGSAELGPEYSCVDLSLRLQEKGLQVRRPGACLCRACLCSPHSARTRAVEARRAPAPAPQPASQRRARPAQVMVAPSSLVFLPDMPDARLGDFLPPFPPASFYKTWGSRLAALVQQRTEVQLTTAYNMHCGGSMGIEAFNFLQVGPRGERGLGGWLGGSWLRASGRLACRSRPQEPAAALPLGGRADGTARSSLLSAPQPAPQPALRSPLTPPPPRPTCRAWRAACRCTRRSLAAACTASTPTCWRARPAALRRACRACASSRATFPRRCARARLLRGCAGALGPWGLRALQGRAACMAPACLCHRHTPHHTTPHTTPHHTPHHTPHDTPHPTPHTPGQVFIHHKDYREVAQHVWPLDQPKAYLIGRYMFEVDKVHSQWAEQIR